MTKRWTEEEVTYLVENYPKFGREFCQQHLTDKSNQAITGKACSLGLKWADSPYKGYSSEEYDNKLLELGINHYPAEKYKGYDVPIKHICLNDHETLRAPASVLKGAGCKICMGLNKPTHEEYLSKLKTKKISYTPLNTYIDTDTPIKHSCSKNHEWLSAPKHILEGRACPQCSPKMGFYSESFFRNNPETGKIPGLLYCVVLVNKKTDERTCVKIGIAKGSSNKDVINRANHFTGYDVRIQKVVSGPLEDIFYLEQYLHELWNDHKYISEWKFGGASELFDIAKLPEILKSIPSKV